MNSSGREAAAVPGSPVEVTGDLTKPSGGLPLIWGRLTTSLRRHGGAKTADSSTLPDDRRASSMPAVAWDGPGRAPGASPSGDCGSVGVSPSVEALSRQGTVSPISSPSFTQIIRVRPRQEGAAALHRSQVRPRQEGTAALHRSQVRPRQEGAAALHRSQVRPRQEGAAAQHRSQVRPRQEGAAALHRSQVSGQAHTNKHSTFDSLYE